MSDDSARLGCWIDLPSPHVAEIVGGAGFDFAVLDLEHGMMSIESASLALMALKGTGTAAYVRVPEASEAWIKRALDAGAGGIMVPNVQDAEQARAIASWFHYAPRGRRGRAPDIIRATGYGRDAAYIADWPGDHQLILQIETPEALADVAEIAAVPGVTMLFFGPTDFTAAGGYAEDAPEISDAARRIAKAAHAAGLSAGTVLFPKVSPPVLVEMGYTHVAMASDVIALRMALDGTLAATRGALK
ncbi:MAG: aldolase/citrate lyase family protein [Pseudomonadota bacterium]